jgi:Pyruvate/2-oxoacid:ferredoxin oxidoreductase delta subunit
VAAVNAILCQCVHGPVLREDTREALSAAVDGLPGCWTVVPDLCGAAARREPWLTAWFERPDAPRVIAACHARAVRWLLRWAGAPAAAVDAVRVLNLRERPPAEAVAALRSLADDPAQPTMHAPPPVADAAWVPWFPVIDRDRCTDCHQCRNFCPFGVYGTDEVGHVEVRQPTHCKTHCPACARLCPAVAIIFPKHNQSPIDGAPVSAADEARSREGQLEKRLKQEDIHAILARRRAPPLKPET